jgi:FKBP-type peptidyl-prolyl cis-trans isomerase SlyD
MIVENKKVVSVKYRLSSSKDKGEEKFVEETGNDNPLVFLFGVGGLIETFENNLKGKKPGDKFDFHIESEKAYGTYDASKIVDIPMEVFLDKDGKLDTNVFKVGAIVPMSDDKGNHMRARIEKMGISHITMDFNHPMAGHDLHFNGEVMDVRDATAEELAHGHVHGPGGHHH